ncbi:NAD-dependent epimerase/dehydratase family protein [Nocardioides insulae]|uniref:NAD-dependent epimerase/dehydratase family protein n=1 Tax=Nocardioides insulae TaxID=394734 RepID=UPI0004249313|nr:NAD-dependent epimerase/dehydratase family protein [Nocardioides insulae]
MSATTHDVVIGAGQVGTTVAAQLLGSGRRVRLITRSGRGAASLEGHPPLERVTADASEPATLAGPFEGAGAVYDCMHGSAYSAKAWRAELPRAERAIMDAAQRAAAVVVFPESLYSYGPVSVPMTEDLPREARTGKLGVRADLLRARAAHPTPTVSVAASDFYGPEVLMAHAHAGERMARAVLDQRTLWVIGRPDAPHAWTYVPDLASAMIRAANDESLWNSFLLAPTAAPVSQREMVERYAEAAGVPAPRVRSIPTRLLKLAGMMSSGAREMAETGYMLDRRFEVDSSLSETRLGLAPTTLEAGVKETIAWWRARSDTGSTGVA